MKLALPIALVSLLPATHASGQATIERTVVDSVSRFERLDFGPLSTGSHQGLFVQEQLLAAEVPALSGVTLRRVEVAGDASVSGELSVTNLNQQPIAIGGTHTNGADCYGATGAWGPIYGSYDYTGFGPATVLPGSMGVVALQPYSTSWNSTYDLSGGAWPQVLTSPVLHADVGIKGIVWSSGGQDVTGWIEARLDVTETATVELEQVAMIATCTSLPNSLGATAQLSAYGSLQSGEDWLTIRATGVPEGEFGLMFVGTQPGIVVQPTYNICLGGSLLRVGGVQMAINTAMDFEFDLAGWMPGDTAYCQVIHRDPVLGICASEAGVVVVE